MTKKMRLFLPAIASALLLALAACEEQTDTGQAPQEQEQQVGQTATQ